jgi:hypothetical protein
MAGRGTPGAPDADRRPHPLGVDFGAHRDSTIQRLIRRRMVLHRRERVDDYPLSAKGTTMGNGDHMAKATTLDGASGPRCWPSST